MNIQTSHEARTFDAIVVGSGISGGWAAKELTKKGLRTLVLERGRNVEHVIDYPTALQHSWDFDHRLALSNDFKKDHFIQKDVNSCNESTQHFFFRDTDQPYTQEKPFGWVRGYQVGGKSLIWGRQTYRLGDLDFEANAKEGIGIDWPIRYRDIAPWYDYVERFIGVSGNRDGIPHLPDGQYLPAMEMNCAERDFKQKTEKQFPGWRVIMGRTANLTVPHNGRGSCQYRQLCSRGCPYGGYFSSNASTLPAAKATGKLTLRPDSVVHSIIYDEQKQKAMGVRVIDAHTKEMTEYYARIIFVNAAALNSTLILLNSTSARFPNGLGNDSGVLGRYLMDHNYRGKASAIVDGFEDQYYQGRRPNIAYMPRFRNIGNDRQKDFLRGYAFGVNGTRAGWERGTAQDGAGAAFKESLTQPGPWRINLMGMGDCLPHEDNRVTLNRNLVDAWGIPTLTFNMEFRENENNMTKDMMQTGVELLEKAGYKNVKATFDEKFVPGIAIHEMGTARMGNDPKTAVLNGFNQVHGCKNVFVTDGACMTSAPYQNPSLTYMALTARAVDYAVKEINRKHL
jgi:choline dehydrogenase-like flavoprotein